MRCKSIIKTFKMTSSAPNIINLAGFRFFFFFFFFSLCDKIMVLIEYRNDG